jgi:hypothetical protein
VDEAEGMTEREWFGEKVEFWGFGGKWRGDEVSVGFSYLRITVLRMVRI